MAKLRQQVVQIGLMCCDDYKEDSKSQKIDTTINNKQGGREVETHTLHRIGYLYWSYMY